MALYALMMVVSLSAGATANYSELVQQARAEYGSGHFAASEKLFAAALQTLQPGDQEQRAATLAELGEVYVSEDELSQAESAYSASLGIYKSLSDQYNTAVLLRGLGATYSLEGRNDDARRLLEQSLKVTKNLPQATPGLMAEVLHILGMVYYRQGNIGKAGALFRQALELTSDSGSSLEVPQMLTNLGAVYIVQHKFDQAEDILKRALQAVEAKHGPLHPDLTFILVALGVLYTDCGRYSDAEAQYLRALKILESHKPEFETRIARILHSLSAMYTKAGRKAEADDILAEAAVIARRNLSQHPDMVTIIEDYSAHLNKQGRTKEADQLRAEAKRGRISSGLVIKAHNSTGDE
jgi:tetratricopeptide (TPR) repeat protein